MKTFKTTCPEDGYSTTVQAETVEEAVDKVLLDPGMQEHVDKNHSQMKMMAPEEMKKTLVQMTVEVPAGMPA